MFRIARRGVRVSFDNHEKTVGTREREREKNGHAMVNRQQCTIDVMVSETRHGGCVRVERTRLSTLTAIELERIFNDHDIHCRTVMSIGRSTTKDEIVRCSTG